MSTQIVSSRQKTGSSNPLGSIAELLGSIGEIGTAVNGKKTKVTTGGSTTTSGLNISQAGVDKVLQDILGGVQGLASVSSGQKTAGLYNSTTNQQLTNDLTSRAAGETAKLQAQTVTTQSPTQSTTFQQPNVDIGTTLITGALGTVGNKLLDEAFGGGGGILNAASDAIGGFFSDAPVSDLVSGVQGLFGSGSGLGFIDEAAGGLLGDIGGDLLGSAGGELFGNLDFLGDFGGGFPVVGTALDLLSGKPEDALLGGAGFLLGNSLLPGIGGPLGALVSDIIPFDDIFGGIGDAFGSVVCTELHAQGLMSKYLYHVDVAYAHKYMTQDTLDGYRYWGIPLVKLMRKHKWVTHVAAWFAVARAHYVVSKFDDGFYNAKLARRGKIINAIGVPLCKLIAKVTTPKDYSTLYVGKAG